MENLNSVCYISQINEIKPIENSDNIELAIVNGWNCVVKIVASWLENECSVNMGCGSGKGVNVEGKKSVLKRVVLGQGGGYILDIHNPMHACLYTPAPQ